MNEERIIRYLSNEMNEEEKQNFLTDLDGSSELRGEFKQLKNVFELTKETRSIDLKPDYKEKIIPAFRAKLEKSNNGVSSFRLRYAVFILFLVIMTGAMYFFLNQNNNHNELVSVEDLTLNEATEYLSLNDILSASTVDEVVSENIDSLYNQEVEKTFEDGEANILNYNYDSGYDYRSLTKDLSQVSLENIYTELLNQEIL